MSFNKIFTIIVNFLPIDLLLVFHESWALSILEKKWKSKFLKKKV